MLCAPYPAVFPITISSISTNGLSAALVEKAVAQRMYNEKHPALVEAEARIDFLQGELLRVQNGTVPQALEYPAPGFRDMGRAEISDLTLLASRGAATLSFLRGGNRFIIPDDVIRVSSGGEAAQFSALMRDANMISLKCENEHRKDSAGFDLFRATDIGLHFRLKGSQAAPRIIHQCALPSDYLRSRGIEVNVVGKGRKILPRLWMDSYCLKSSLEVSPGEASCVSAVLLQPVHSRGQIGVWISGSSSGDG